MEEVVLIVEDVVVAEGAGADCGDKEITMEFEGPESVSIKGTNEDLGSNPNNNSEA